LNKTIRGAKEEADSRLLLLSWEKRLSRQHLDGEPANSKKEVKGPRPMLSAGRRHVEAIVFQLLVDFVNPLLALLTETDVKSGGVFDLSFPTYLHARQREYHVVVVRQKAHVVVASHVPHSEVFFEEFAGFGYVDNREIEVI
jgi:hypothetical protein